MNDQQVAGQQISSTKVIGDDDPPTIAAIIPLYNGARYIEAALKSTLDQSLGVTEVFVVDDGSTDNGPELVAEYAQRDARVRLLRKENGGQSSARNAAVAATACEYLAFLDQDDTWYREHLELLYSPFGQDRFARLGFVYGDIDEIDGQDRLVFIRLLSRTRATHPKTSIFNCIGEDMFVLPGASLVRTKAFREVGGFDERLIGYEDDDLFRRIFEAGYSNAFVEASVGRWRIHPSSTSYTYKMQISRMIYANKLIDSYPDDAFFNRYFVRDHIAPRFTTTLMDEWLRAIRLKNEELAMVLRRDIAAMAKLMAPTRLRTKVNLLVLATANWRLFQRVYEIGSSIPGVRRLFRMVG